ncbi:hypothetical protein [Spirillospora sp. NPDC048819]|uniref:hypothetical protein n=1 Tax=Spirillospora sp. NPDC048819 TaxID=3155268 RepID=UPI0033F87EE5
MKIKELCGGRADLDGTGRADPTAVLDVPCVLLRPDGRFADPAAVIIGGLSWIGSRFMRPPEELSSVDWSALTHAYGPADDVPELIHALYLEDEEQVEEALYELFGNVHHQGTVYPATVEAVPFLAHAALHAVLKRDHVLLLLVVIADQATPADPVTEAARAAVGAVAPALSSCLDDADPAVRRMAVRVAAVATDPDAVAERLTAVYVADPDADVRADALTALARVDPDEAREAAALGDGVPAIRLAAALLRLERSAPPYPAELIDVLAADGTHADGETFPGLGSQQDRLTTLLTADVDAGLAVAARWVAAGDPGGRGFWLAEDVANAWRDREEQVVAVLAASLPHQMNADSLGLRLEAIARWISGVQDVEAGLRDVLLGHAASAEPRVAHAAQLALARCGDERVLTGPFEPCALALAVAPGDALAHVRKALPAADDNSAIALVSALDPGTAAQLLPELTDLLRAGQAVIPVARVLGTLDGADREVLGLLAEAMKSDNEMLRATAAASHALLTGEAAPSIRVLEPLLTTGRQIAWYLPEAGRLGTAGAPLVPRIEELLGSHEPWPRMAAAEALWRITGDSASAVPVLTELAGASPVGLRALETLAEIGMTPAELRPRLRHCAWSPTRLMSVGWPPEIPHPDEKLRATALRLLG